MARILAHREYPVRGVLSGLGCDAGDPQACRFEKHSDGHVARPLKQVDRIASLFIAHSRLCSTPGSALSRGALTLVASCNSFYSRLAGADATPVRRRSVCPHEVAENLCTWISTSTDY